MGDGGQPSALPSRRGWVASMGGILRDDRAPHQSGPGPGLAPALGAPVRVGGAPPATVNPWLFLGAAAALTVERVGYVSNARAPASFRAWCARPAVARLGEPVAVVEKMFCGFKVIQAAVFAAWCYGHGSLAPAASGWALAGAAVRAGPQRERVLPARAKRRVLRRPPGLPLPWCQAFPFSVLSHPQYVGAEMTIWSIFIAMRFPHPDWIALPILETAYYGAGAVLEQGSRGRRGARGRFGPRGRMQCARAMMGSWRRHDTGQRAPGPWPERGGGHL